MGTVPVLLASNHVGEGMDEASGAVTVQTIEEMAPAAHALLDDPVRLAALAAAGRRQAREAVAWEPFVSRVAAALAVPDHEVAQSAAGRAGLAARLVEREEAVRRHAEHAASEAHARALAAREHELHAALLAEAQRADEMSRLLAVSDARLQALRSRKAVRVALRAAGAAALILRGSRT